MKLPEKQILLNASSIHRIIEILSVTAPYDICLWAIELSDQNQ